MHFLRGFWSAKYNFLFAQRGLHQKPIRSRICRSSLAAVEQLEDRCLLTGIGIQLDDVAAFNPVSPSILGANSTGAQFPGAFNNPVIRAIFPEGPAYSKVVEGDFNADGHSDFAAFGSTQNVGQWYVAASDGAGNYTVQLWADNLMVDTWWHDFYVGDVSGDGVDDIVGFFTGYFFDPNNPAAGSLPGQWWVFTSDPANNRFTTTPMSASGEWSFSSAFKSLFIGDFNGDMLTDVGGYTVGLDGPYSGIIFIALADGTGGFEPFKNWSRITIPGGDIVHSVHVGNFNGDAFDDLAVFADDDFAGPDARWYVAISAPQAGFFSTALFDDDWAVAETWVSMGVGDFNGDGIDDVYGRSNSGALFVGETFLRELAPGFGIYQFEASQWEGGLRPGSDVMTTLASDFNNDGEDDVLTYYSNGDLEVAESRGETDDDFDSAVWQNFGFGFLDQLFAADIL